MKKNITKIVVCIVLVVVLLGICIAIGMSVANKDGDSGKDGLNQEQAEEPSQEQDQGQDSQPADETEEDAANPETEEPTDVEAAEEEAKAVETPFDMENPIPNEDYAAIVGYQAKKEQPSGNGQSGFEVIVTVPQLTMRSATAGTINEKLLAFYLEGYEYGIASAEKDVEFQNEASEELDEYSYYDYSYSLGYKVTLLDEKYLSVLAEGYEYMGGAHGMPFRTALIFNLETGEQVVGDSLLQVDAKQVHEKKVDAYRELFENSEEGEYWPDALSTIENESEEEQRYYLSEEGVTFYYDPYELAPYAAGYVEATVPYETLPLR